MTDELERNLLIKHFRIFGVDRSSLDVTTHWEIGCGDGWFMLLEKLCDDIQAHIEEQQIPQVEFSQIKEKFGELRVYYSRGDQRVEELINGAEIASKITCENCGNIGEVQRTRYGWIKTLCADCLTKTNE
ncbi:hypothetical protein [Pseudomonas coronafaciens]|uniref:Uncharacterized protein n=1 Tax=Pseudomonas coronafaciens pv. coronafaciens TaxID=235275 RepID=A0AAE6QKZ5_9PSED|nr:hypothetical protein [Pseudomonas coronafaciens]QGT82820.1 hypothetical protein GMO17_17430 [Pseudomonas coronafaciens pv. coronafaciens]